MSLFKCKECKKVVAHFEIECSYCGAKKNQLPLIILSAIVLTFLIYIIDKYLS